MMQVFSSIDCLRLVRLEISLEEFPKYLRIGMGDDGRFQKAEASAQKLIKENFSFELCVQFITAVCSWGGDPRKPNRIFKNNTVKQISAALREAHECTHNDRIREALGSITRLHGLSVSFGSKHLKFLNLERHVVLDRIISERLGYTRDETGDGYMSWRSACQEFLEIIRLKNIDYPGTGQNGWRISDVEMAIFNKIR